MLDLLFHWSLKIKMEFGRFVSVTKEANHGMPRWRYRVFLPEVSLTVVLISLLLEENSVCKWQPLPGSKRTISKNQTEFQGPTIRSLSH